MKSHKRITVIAKLLIVSMIASMFSLSTAAAAPTAESNKSEVRSTTNQTITALSDVSNSYAAKEINELVASGVLSGYPDGKFYPFMNMTRAELAKTVVKALKLEPNEQAASPFADVPNDAWYKGYVGAIVKSGIAQGTSSRTFAPNQKVTREELAVFFVRALGMKDKADQWKSNNAPFKDMNDVSSWAKSSVTFAGEIGLIQGGKQTEGGNQFYPQLNSDRQALARLTYELMFNKDAFTKKADEIVKNKTKSTTTSTSSSSDSSSDSDSDNSISQPTLPPVACTAVTEITKDGFKGNRCIDKQGTYGPTAELAAVATIEGELTVNVPNVTLQNIVIKGDLIIGEGVGQGDVTLTNVKVEGKTIVKGGGKNSIHLNNSVLATIIVDKRTGDVRVAINDGTKVELISLQSGAILDTARGQVTNVTLGSSLPQASTVELRGTFETVNVVASNVRLHLNANATVASLVVDAPSAITGNGTITSAQVNHAGAVFSQVPANCQGCENLSTFIVGGHIVDIAKLPLKNIKVAFRDIANPTIGEVVATTTTNDAGYYEVKLRPGTYSAEVSGDGFINTHFTVVVASNGYVWNESPETAIRLAGEEEVRVVLSWGEKPVDLDSHLIGPGVDGERFHTFFDNRQYKRNGQLYVDLDHDDVTAYGPETTTIRKQTAGTYRFYVHNFSGESNLEEQERSDTVVQVYQGSASTPAKTFTLEKNALQSLNTHRYWVAFEMTVNADGTISYNEVNTFHDDDKEIKGPDESDVTVTSSVYSLNSFNGTISGMSTNTTVAELKQDIHPVNPQAKVQIESANGTLRTDSDFVQDGDKLSVISANGQNILEYRLIVPAVLVEAAQPTVAEAVYLKAGQFTFTAEPDAWIEIKDANNNLVIAPLCDSSGQCTVDTFYFNGYVGQQLFLTAHVNGKLRSKVSTIIVKE
ncbi:S-layer homology domain-containing protein [Paenibacillus sp. 481]|uniref:S-layer homology domain-containing protein n=1 Tax=Paenibacillus sp. 481 TaxID=2835869 RepID=UPI001E5FE0C3|nr:S-layer homology domain-containing protein [Paenibacillus sp. 481]UHA74861.1 S-layer homology domain-containing protein [Paenibacillus sp. 481]